MGLEGVIISYCLGSIYIVLYCARMLPGALGVLIQRGATALGSESLSHPWLEPQGHGVAAHISQNVKGNAEIHMHVSKNQGHLINMDSK